MKKLFLIYIISVITIFSQEKYLIYFKDKGVFPNSPLNKLSKQYLEAESELTNKSIERRKSVMGKNYITYEDLPIRKDYIEQISSLGIKIENKLKWFNAVSCYLDKYQIEKILKLDFVNNIEKVKSFNSSKITEDNSINKNNSKTDVANLDYGKSFNQNNLSEIPLVHDLGYNGQNVILGILDTGFRWKNHPALKNLKIIAERDFIQNDDITENQTSDSPSQDFHGTAVLSLACGYEPGNIIGPAFGANIILAKTENVSSETRVEEDNYAAALEWMEAQGVHITTSSLGYNQFDNPAENYTFSQMDGKTTIVAKAANLAFQRGVSTFTAAGNERGNSWGKIISPADAFGIIAVGAVNSSNQIASFSSPGPTSDGRIKPEIVAMGVSNYHAIAGGTYGSGSGTSYATPIAAGIAAILKSAWPHLTNSQIRNIFLKSGDNVNNPNNDRGYGLISAKKAVTYPNLQLINNNLRLNKIFINNDGVISPIIYIKIDNGNFQGIAMNNLSNAKYYVDFNYLSPNTKVEFYFSYTTINGINIKEPEVGTYNFNTNELNITTDVTNIEELPNDFYLYQNYPNPVSINKNEETLIRYTIPKNLTDINFSIHSESLNSQSSINYNVTLKVYDILGREVATLVNAKQISGNYEVKFNIKNLSSGVYFYRLQTGNLIQTKKMLIVN